MGREQAAVRVRNQNGFSLLKSNMGCWTIMEQCLQSSEGNYFQSNHESSIRGDYGKSAHVDLLGTLLRKLTKEVFLQDKTAK